MVIRVSLWDSSAYPDRQHLQSRLDIYIKNQFLKQKGVGGAVKMRCVPPGHTSRPTPLFSTTIGLGMYALQKRRVFNQLLCHLNHKIYVACLVHIFAYQEKS